MDEKKKGFDWMELGKIALIAFVLIMAYHHGLFNFLAGGRKRVAAGTKMYDEYADGKAPVETPKV